VSTSHHDLAAVVDDATAATVQRLHPPTVASVQAAVDAIARVQTAELKANADLRHVVGGLLVRVNAGATAAERAELAAATAQREATAAATRASSAVAVAAEARDAALAARAAAELAQATAMRTESAVRSQGADLADVQAYAIKRDEQDRKRERRAAAVKGGGLVGSVLTGAWLLVQLLEAFR
jgi:hypothetical protein